MAQAAVQLQKRTFKDQDLNFLQTDTAQAVQELSLADQPTVTVLTDKASQSLTGNEDYVLVDMSSATKDTYLLLPNPMTVTRAITVKLVQGGKAKLFVKASDAGTVKINTSTAPVQVTDSVKLVATPTQYYTV